MYENTASTGQAINSSAEQAESSRSLVYRASSKSGSKSYRENCLENKTKMNKNKKSHRQHFGTSYFNSIV